MLPVWKKLNTEVSSSCLKAASVILNCNKFGLLSGISSFHISDYSYALMWVYSLPFFKSCLSLHQSLSSFFLEHFVSFLTQPDFLKLGQCGLRCFKSYIYYIFMITCIKIDNHEYLKLMSIGSWQKSLFVQKWRTRGQNGREIGLSWSQLGTQSKELKIPLYRLILLKGSWIPKPNSA